MSLENLIGTKQAELAIVGADGAPFHGSDGDQWKITIAGPTHPKGFAAEEMLRLHALRSLEGKGETSEQYIERVIEPLVTRTLSWSPITFHGEPFPCTQENARKLYRESDLVRKQVEGFIYKTANFLKPPSVS
jgi:hypothetical protein